MRWTLEGINTGLDHIGFYQANRVDVSMREDAMILVFSDYGDLPVALAIGESQIMVEASLVERHEFTDPSEIDYRLLSTHKYLPLSTIAIQNINGVDWYVLFGALSAYSRIEVIAEELLALVSNTFSVIDTLEPLYSFNVSSTETSTREVQ
ncbi:MAG: DUF2170 family protein [Pseudomonadales bacterium]|nr:DUF2170 family protein [Pseudomonadales bacterium]